MPDANGIMNKITWQCFLKDCPLWGAVPNHILTSHSEIYSPKYESSVEKNTKAKAQICKYDNLLFQVGVGDEI